jgi:hypothetical protein
MTEHELDRRVAYAYYKSRRAIDLMALHRRLWRQANKRHRLAINKRQLATELSADYFTLWHTIDEMCRQGRLRRVGSGNYSIGTYLVADPNKWLNGTEDVSKKMSWG